MAIKNSNDQKFIDWVNPNEPFTDPGFEYQTNTQ